MVSIIPVDAFQVSPEEALRRLLDPESFRRFHPLHPTTVKTSTVFDTMTEYVLGVPVLRWLVLKTPLPNGVAYTLQDPGRGLRIRGSIEIRGVDTAEAVVVRARVQPWTLDPMHIPTAGESLTCVVVERVVRWAWRRYVPRAMADR